jgi:hypothetical protein
MDTIGKSISRVRGIIKAAQEDSFLTDRFVYAIISKYAKTIIERQQKEKKLMGHDDLFETLPFVELTDVNKIEAECAPIKTNCTLKRTEIKLPQMFKGKKGPLIRKVYSIDGSKTFTKTSPAQYIELTNSTCFKYNDTDYYWFRNDHLYFPDNEVEAIMIEALWEDTLDKFCTLNDDECTSMQDRKFPLPEYLFSEVEQMAEQEFGMTMRIPDDGADDGQNVMR